MSVGHNIERLRAGFSASRRGEVFETDWVSPECAHTVRGRSVVSSVYHGWEEMVRVLSLIQPRSAGTVGVTPEVVLADDDNIVMYAHVTGSRPDGRVSDNYKGSLCRFRDGRVDEGQPIPVAPEAFAELPA